MIYNKLKELVEKNKNWSDDINIKKGKMRKLLNIPDNKNIEDVYPSGKQLAMALLNVVKDKNQIMSMLIFSANIDNRNNVFDKALKYIKSKVQQ